MLLTASVLFVMLGLAEAQPRPPPPLSTPAYSYMVLVPRNIRPDTTLSVPVQFAVPVTGESVTVKLIHTRRIRGAKQPEVTIVAEETAIVSNGGKDVVLKLKVPPKVTWGSYGLNVTGVGSVAFHGSTYVYGRAKSLAIFVQTDKAMYKPGDTVQYRIFAVDSKLELKNPTLDIEFFDPKGNKIDEVTGVKNKPVVEGTLRLSDMPPLGRWKISVKSRESEEREDYTFEVKEYVLPKFEVTVTLPPFGKESDTSLTGTAQALYTFGKPVAGNAVLTISKRYHSGFFDIKAVQSVVALGVDGTASFSIPMDVLKRITRNTEYETFVVHANVTETITGITLEGQAEISYHKNPYKIDFFPNMPDNFKPGFNPYNVWVKVTQQDGRPPESTTVPMSVTVTYFTDKRVASPPQVPGYNVISPFIGGDVIMEDTKSYLLGSDGTVKFNENIPENAATATIKAEFAGVQSYKEIRRFRSPENVFLKSTMENDVHTKPLTIGDTVTIKVTSSAGPVNVKYVFLSRGQQVDSGDIITSGTLNECRVQTTVTRDMAPTARFVVYYVTDSGEIVADGLNFVIEEIFENKVTIEFLQPSPQEPKSKVSLKVTADKNSIVNILAVDKSVKLLADGNDITTERVMDEMNKFGNSPIIMRGWGPAMPWSFPADDSYDIFETAGLKVLTDANLHRFNLWSLKQTSTQLRAFSTSADMMGSGGGVPNSPTGQIRKDFPETWIWKSAIARNGIAEFPEIVPDTITEFIASAFALNTKTGLGVATSTANLTVFLPFFVNLQLPYSVIRYEIAVIQANIFNYLDIDHYVSVRLQASDDFVGVTYANSYTETEVTGDITKCVLVKKGQPTPVYFNIKPKKIKDITLNVRASISAPTSVFDEVIRTLPVKAEGVEREKNTPVLISHQQVKPFSHVAPITYPTELVPDSERIRVTTIGDVFGPSFENLDQLIRLPYGCGEQNMVNFAPMVFAAAYMKTTGRFTDKKDLMDKIRNYMKTGYQRQLLYQRHDGSFSAFGNADSEGSMWLTTFVIKSFAQAKTLNMIFIDPNVIEKAVKFIVNNHLRRDGTINNVGIVSHKALQGGSAASNRSILAYVLLSFQEVKQAEILVNLETIKKMDDAIRSITYAIKGHIGDMTTDYEKAIGAYALKLVNDPDYATLLSGLEKSGNRVVKDGTTHWNNPSRALEIEITSYALLTYASMTDKTNGMMILKWLVDSRNPYGGFSSTQDTVVGLQAFSEFATLIYSKQVTMSIEISTRTNGVDGKKQVIQLDTQNHDILHYMDFDGSVDEVHIAAKGIGLAMIDIKQFFNVKSEAGQAYELNVITTNESKNKYTVRACARFLVPGQDSNMAIMDFGVVSGFEPIKNLVVLSPLMKRAELASGRLLIYFDKIPHKEVCVDVPMQRVSIVSGVKDADVVVYSYYDPSEKFMKRYMPSMLTNESLCTTCPKCCEANDLPSSTCMPIPGNNKTPQKHLKHVATSGA